jgi:bifunctional DNase/RNase
MTDQHNPLKKPSSVRDDAVAQEMIRFWLQDNTDHVSLMVGGAEDPKTEAPMWGFILADIAKHVTKAMRQTNPDGPSAQDIISDILQGMAERIKHAPELSGSVEKAGD